MTRTDTEPLDYRRYWERAYLPRRYLEDQVESHRELWHGVYRTSRVPKQTRERVEALDGRWRLLVLAEDWCGDAVNLVPPLARLAESVSNLEMRVLERDENPRLMDRYLTDGSRSIPVVIVLDEGFRPVARWGPRPRKLQEYVLTEKAGGELPKSEIYKKSRRWYARDRGETTFDELIEAMKESLAAVD